MNKTHFNKLTPAESERLAVLMEELAEVQQVIGKILRHGYDSCHPDNPSTNNRELLQKELGDVQAAFELMDNAGDIKSDIIAQFSEDKLTKIEKYLHHNKID